MPGVTALDTGTSTGDPSAMSGRLNTFQKLAVAWNGHWPYNAVHVLRVSGSPDENRLRASIHDTLNAYGISSYHLSSSGSRFTYAPGGDIPIQISSVDKDVQESLRACMEDGLNRFFETDKTFFPLSFFILKDIGSFYLGVVYNHVIADADSIIRLINHISGNYSAVDDGGTPVRVNIYPSPNGHGAWKNPAILWKWLSLLSTDIRDVRQTIRIIPDTKISGRNGLLLAALDERTTQRLLDLAKQWNVTVNDVLLAALWRSVSPLFQKAVTTKRHRLAVASVISIRSDLKKTPKDFGLFLSSFRVSRPATDASALQQVAVDINRQTQRAKRHKLYLRSLAEMRAGLRLLPYYKEDYRKRFFAKYYPLAAGLTNIHLQRIWSQEGSPEEPQDYMRAVSTSPATPLIVSATTIRGRMNLSLSFSGQVYSQTHAASVLKNFTTELKGSTS